MNRKAKFEKEQLKFDITPETFRMGERKFDVLDFYRVAYGELTLRVCPRESQAESRKNGHFV